MVYQPRPFAVDDTLVSSRDQIRTNFELIQTQFEANHVNIANDGKHKFLQMPEQATAPTTAANEGALYTKAVSGATQLFWREEGNGQETQITPTVPIKAAVKFSVGAGPGFAITINYQSNVASVVRTTAGVYNITFTNALSSSNYIIQIDFADTTFAANKHYVAAALSASINTGGFGISVLNFDTKALSDPASVMITVIGG